MFAMKKKPPTPAVTDPAAAGGSRFWYDGRTDGGMPKAPKKRTTQRPQK
jgi:hypothetical protein